MIGRRTRIQLAVFALIAVLGMAFTGARYAGLNVFAAKGYLVAADFADSGGIFTGAEVTERGVPAGKVERLELRPDGVRVFLRLRAGVRIPDDVRALVADRSAIGEQYIDLQPQRSTPPYLHRNAVIPVADSSVPVSPTQLLLHLDQLVRSVDLSRLGILLDELGSSFQDTGPSLQRLVDAGDALTASATAALPQTTRLIQDGQVVLQTQRDVGAQFRAFNRDLAALSSTLRSSDPDLRALFANGTAGAEATNGLLQSNRSALPVLLSNLVTVAQVQAVRLPALKETLVIYPNVVAGGFTVVPGDGSTHFGLVTEANPPPCTRGYGTTVKREPSDTRTVTPNLRAYCAEPSGSPTDVRGAQNAPRPSGTAPFPYPGTARAADVPTAAAGMADLPLGPQDSSGPVVLGGLDPVTGQVILPDGSALRLGSAAGADRVYGDQSWQLLLLGPLSPGG